MASQKCVTALVPIRNWNFVGLQRRWFTVQRAHAKILIQGEDSSPRFSGLNDESGANELCVARRYNIRRERERMKRRHTSSDRLLLMKKEHFFVWKRSKWWYSMRVDIKWVFNVSREAFRGELLEVLINLCFSVIFAHKLATYDNFMSNYCPYRRARKGWDKRRQIIQSWLAFINTDSVRLRLLYRNWIKH